jgi:hypothetical protein
MRGFPLVPLHVLRVFFAVTMFDPKFFLQGVV